MTWSLGGSCAEQTCYRVSDGAVERASWPKRMSRSGWTPKRKRTREKQKGGNGARIQETKPVPETNITKAFGDAEKE